MTPFTETQLEMARDIAKRCLTISNELIATANGKQFLCDFQGNIIRELRLTTEIETFCQFLDATREPFYALREHIRQCRERVSQKPVEHGILAEPTAHHLAWSFAHYLWLGITFKIQNQSARDCTGWHDRHQSSYLLDVATIERYSEPIRDHLCTITKIEARKWWNMIDQEFIFVRAMLPPEAWGYELYNRHDLYSVGSFNQTFIAAAGPLR